jgi:hypothetical protein
VEKLKQSHGASHLCTRILLTLQSALVLSVISFELKDMKKKLYYMLTTKDWIIFLLNVFIPQMHTVDMHEIF